MPVDQNTSIVLSDKLRKKLEKKLPEYLNGSSVFVDLADISEIATTYLSAIDQLNSVDLQDHDAVLDILMQIQIELFEHLPMHLKPFEKHLEDLIDLFSSDTE